MTKMLTLTVNGEEHGLDVPAHWTLLQLPKDELGLIGPKDGFRPGACRSCPRLVA